MGAWVVNQGRKQDFFWIFFPFCKYFYRVLEDNEYSCLEHFSLFGEKYFVGKILPLQSQ